MGISARTRFEIFKRDGFRCVYCGAAPLTSPLHVDHVVAIANDGTDDPSNLVTACVDCNLGKSAVPLDRKKYEVRIADEADREQAQQILDHAEQIKEYLAIQREVQEARHQATDIVADRWEELIGPLTQGMYDRLERLIPLWPMDKLEEAMQITARKMGTPGEEFGANTAVKQAKYFQGILRHWREREAVE